MECFDPRVEGRLLCQRVGYIILLVADRSELILGDHLSRIYHDRGQDARTCIQARSSVSIVTIRSAIQRFSLPGYSQTGGAPSVRKAGVPKAAIREQSRNKCGPKNSVLYVSR